MQLDLQIRPIAVSSKNMDIRSLIKCIDQRLLYFLIDPGVQRIDSDDLIEDLFILLANLWDRISHNRVTPLIPPDILIGNLTLAAVVEQYKFLLLFGQFQYFFLLLGRKRFFSKHLNAGRTGKPGSQFLITLIRSLDDFQLPFQELFIQKQRLVIPMVILVLLIRDSPKIPNL